MGVKNFKPSIHHKMQSGHKVFNILNDPMIALVSPRIQCEWEGGAPPRFNKHLQKKFQDLEGVKRRDGLKAPNILAKISPSRGAKNSVLPKH